MVYRNYGNFEFDPKPLLESPPALSVIDSALLVDLDLDGNREYVIAFEASEFSSLNSIGKRGLTTGSLKQFGNPKPFSGLCP